MIYILLIYLVFQKVVIEISIQNAYYKHHVINIML